MTFGQRLSNNAGFTLVELLVVILIIGILAAVAIPVFLGQKGKATNAIAKANVGTRQAQVLWQPYGLNAVATVAYASTATCSAPSKRCPTTRSPASARSQRTPIRPAAA